MIKILDKALANKIAAGEVITSPGSVVKELVENSIDAGSSKITAEIKRGGKEYIRVIDNGSGIAGEETELAFKKHATGKISTEEDMNNISTLGFRGEALGSIAAVSKLEMITKTAADKAGTRLLMQGGTVIEKKHIGCEQGTAITVSDIFFNTPARRKFMRSDSSETTNITDMMSKVAIAYPGISFRYISNGKTLFNTRGDGNRLNTILTVYGGGMHGKLIPIEVDEGRMSLNAYISDPSETRPTRKQQIFFVNGRLVTNKLMEKAVSRAYASRMFKGRYPICFLFLDVPSDKLDVNIHPSKDEVRFYEENKVDEFIEKSLREALKTAVAIPAVKVKTSSENKNDETSKKQNGVQFDFESYAENLRSKIRENSNADILNTKSRSSVSRFGSTQDFPSNDITTGSLSSASEDEFDWDKVLGGLREEKNSELAKQQINPEYKKIYRKDDLGRPFHFADFRLEGIIFDTYILATLDDTFYMIDQHAAHERVMYEKILGSLTEGEAEIQDLLVPVTFETPIEPEEWARPLAELGFRIEEFGPKTYRIVSVPFVFTDIDIVNFINDYLDEAESMGRGKYIGEELNDRIATMACKSAVKAHDKLKESEVKMLFKQLDDCKNPFSCPHGRPTFMQMSIGEIERNFKRK